MPIDDQLIRKLFQAYEVKPLFSEEINMKILKFQENLKSLYGVLHTQVMHNLLDMHFNQNLPHPMQWQHEATSGASPVAGLLPVFDSIFRLLVQVTRLIP